MSFLATVLHRSWRRLGRSRRHEQTDESDDRSMISVQITDAAVPRRPTEKTAAGLDPSTKKPPLLFALAQSWAWQAILFRCQSHPHEAKLDFRDDNGDNLLHWCVFGRPPVDVIETLLNVAPELAQGRNHKGLLPLHVACSYRACANVIRALITAFPAAARDQGNGSYPLHLLCDFGCSIDAIRVLLETPGGVATLQERDATYQQSPLYILNGRKSMGVFLRHFDKLRTLRQRQQALRAEGSHNDVQVAGTQEVLHACRSCEFWQKAALLMLAQNQGRPIRASDETDARVLQASVHVDAPSSLKEYAILLLQHELLTRDEQGNVPLHVAALHASPSIGMEVLRGNVDAARIRNHNGELPLVLADRRSRTTTTDSWLWSDGSMAALAQANPCALEELDLDDRLYPRIWSKLSSSPDTLYQSIRAHPSSVRRPRDDNDNGNL